VPGSLVSHALPPQVVATAGIVGSDTDAGMESHSRSCASHGRYDSLEYE
jgi:hypothetical protein